LQALIVTEESKQKAGRFFKLATWLKFVYCNQ